MQHYTKYKQGVTWNAIEAIVIQGLLAANQFLLFRVLPTDFYGLTAVIFSLIYIALPIINLGFDASLPIFINKYITSKSAFTRLLIPQAIAQLALITCAGGIYIGCINKISGYWFSSVNILQLPSSFFILVLAIIIAESMKKSLRAFTHACFLNRPTMFIELSAVWGYMGLVWGMYFINGSLSLWTIFIPLLIESCWSSAVLVYIIMTQLYNKFSAAKSSVKISFTRIFKNRILAYINQLSMIFFTRNFLIPFLSWLFGLAAIGALKLISELAIFVLVFIEKLFGTTGSALLAHVKFEPLKKRREAFTLLAQQLFFVLFAIIIFLAFNGRSVFCLYSGPITDYYLALLFFFTIIFENIFLMYERFALIEEKIYITILLNLLSAGICFPLAIFLNASLPATIIVIIVTRIIAFLILSLIYLRCWNIPQKIKLNIPLLFLVVLISYLLFCFFNTTLIP